MTNSNFANLDAVNSNLGDSANPNSNFGSLASKDGINFKAVLSGETSAGVGTEADTTKNGVTNQPSTQTAQTVTSANQPSDEIIKNTAEYHQQDNSQNAQFIPLVIGLLALGTVSYLNAPGTNDKPKSGMTPVAEGYLTLATLGGSTLLLAGKTTGKVVALKEGAENSATKIFENAAFSQKTFNQKFSDIGMEQYSKLAGTKIETVDDLANSIQKGLVKPEQLPVEYIIRDGNTLILNTRTSQALQKAGVPRSQWTGKDMSGQELFENILTNRLKSNKLDSKGVDSVRQGSGGKR